MRPLGFLGNAVLLFIGFSTSLSISSLHAQEKINAVIPGDFADPSIIRKGSQYYAVGTSSEWAPHFPIYTSDNLQNWKQVGYVFDQAPEWTSGSFWAPEYYYHNNTYFIYYTARKKKDNMSCIGVATSAYPDHGFKDQGIIIDFGKEAIDGFVYNDNGQLYISFKAYGLDERPIEILASKLSADGLHLEGEPFSLLKDEERIGLEGQSFLKKDDYYYLFYSAGACCGLKCDYNVRVARSKDFKGPYERYSANPILQENEQWKCSGHGTFVQAENNATFFLYHAYNKTSTVYTGRQGLLAELEWPEKNGWPVFKKAIPTNAVKYMDLKDDFNAAAPGKYWQWDFRNSTPVAKQSKGNLVLSGILKEGNKTGLVLTVRPADAAFTISTTVQNQNSAVKGLAYYGDVGAAIGIGCSDNKIVVWQVREKNRVLLVEMPTKVAGPVKLKMSVTADHRCSFHYKLVTGGWKELVPKESVSAEFLPQWDRSPRPGLHFLGTEQQQAIFSDVELSYP